MPWSQCGNTGSGQSSPPSTFSTSTAPTMAGSATDVPAASPTRMPSAANGRLPSQHARIIAAQADAGSSGRAAVGALSGQPGTAGVGGRGNGSPRAHGHHEVDRPGGARPAFGTGIVGLVGEVEQVEDDREGERPDQDPGGTQHPAQFEGQETGEQGTVSLHAGSSRVSARNASASPALVTSRSVKLAPDRTSPRTVASESVLSRLITPSAWRTCWTAGSARSAPALASGARNRTLLVAVRRISSTVPSATTCPLCSTTTRPAVSAASAR